MFISYKFIEPTECPEPVNLHRQGGGGVPRTPSNGYLRRGREAKARAAAPKLLPQLRERIDTSEPSANAPPKNGRCPFLFRHV